MESKGVYLAFKPTKTEEEQISRLNILLVNPTDWSLLFDYTFYLNDITPAKIKSKIAPQSFILLNEISIEQLNDFPVAQFEFWNEQANENHLKKTIPIKAKSFFNKKQLVPLLNEEAFLFFLFSEFPKQEIKKQESENIFSPKTKTSDVKNEIIRQANFETAIDLHIERLISSHKGMSNTEIIKIQLSRFQKFLEQAITERIPKIYVIHGVGKGKLKDEIHSLLLEYNEVQSFNNDYHSKYGFGATEIFLSSTDNL